VDEVLANPRRRRPGAAGRPGPRRSRLALSRRIPASAARTGGSSGSSGRSPLPAARFSA